MIKIIFKLIIILVILLYNIEGIDDDLFENLWKNVSPFKTDKSFKKQKFVENCVKKEETADILDENYQHKIVTNIAPIKLIKSENCSDQEMEDIKPNDLKGIKNEQFVGQNEFMKAKINVPKIENGQLSNETAAEDGIEKQQLTDDQINSSDLDSSDTNAKLNDEFGEEMEMETLEKFNLMKKNLRNENCYKNLSTVKFECEIANKLGTNRTNIFKLKQKFGQKQQKKSFSQNKEINKNTKMELIREFDQMKKEKIYGFNYDKRKRAKIEKEIMHNLGISRREIKEWKNEFDSTKKFKTFTNKQKHEIIELFEKCKEEFSKKFHLIPTWKIETKIAQKIGVEWNSIYNWKRSIGLITAKSKHYTDDEKLKFLKRIDKIRKTNPMISDKEIAKKFGVHRNSLICWRKKFGIENRQ